ncbi:hypothetical protein F7725_008767 [Dissostichus mawsoni]|uniref:Helicase ATP-binding domain-containing protein n=1 Tax=Dissostichus mawsoni TaxID=36200 RepID=A0A7J5Y835_DISMA|nr:hypothetical protein F7725_008767 [Dissostichus mawsoni]
MKLIDEGLVVRVKGRGLAGSFKLGKKCKESEKTAVLRQKLSLKYGEHAEENVSETAKDKAESDSRTSSQEVGDPPLLPSPDSRFECLCGGESGFYDGKHLVQCLSCDLWQHALESRSSRPFYCPHCLVAAPPLCSGATLIISPSSICHQWGEEIQRHGGKRHFIKLNVVFSQVYQGVKRHFIKLNVVFSQVYQGVKRHGFLQPRLLAQQDVVITTYDVLRSELNYVDIPHSNSEDGRRFRNRKRYMAVPSPLVAVQWWRICLDEAQMVECPTAKAAEMALRLSSVNRWCVSGTPVQRGLEDLYGLVLFLGVDPFWVKHWWLQILYRPFRRGNTAPLYRGHFYHRQHEVCSHDALLQLRKVSDWSLKLGSLDRRSVQNILNPLLRLRQACCHPQAVRGEFLPLQKSTMTMEELLKSLQKKCRVECEEAHRQLVCALNGRAGIHIIRGEYLEAVEMYREVLRSSEEHKGRLKTDSLQTSCDPQPDGAAKAKHSGIPPTLRDDRLSDEAEQLRQHYMTKYDSEVSDALQALQPVLQSIKELRRKVKLNSPWWLEVVQRAVRCSTDDELVSRIKNDLTSSYKQQASKLSMADKT